MGPFLPVDPGKALIDLLSWVDLRPPVAGVRVAVAGTWRRRRVNRGTNAGIVQRSGAPAVRGKPRGDHVPVRQSQGGSGEILVRDNMHAASGKAISDLTLNPNVAFSRSRRSIWAFATQTVIRRRLSILCFVGATVSFLSV